MKASLRSKTLGIYRRISNSRRFQETTVIFQLLCLGTLHSGGAVVIAKGRGRVPQPWGPNVPPKSFHPTLQTLPGPCLLPQAAFLTSPALCLCLNGMSFGTAMAPTHLCGGVCLCARMPIQTLLTFAWLKCNQLHKGKIHICSSISLPTAPPSDGV